MLAGGHAENVTGWHVLEAARNGDKLGATLVHNLGEHLGLGIASLVNLFNPQMVVLHRSLEIAGPALLDHIARVVRRKALRRSSELLEFRYSQFQKEGGVLGVALMILEKTFEIPALRPPQFLVDAEVLNGKPAKVLTENLLMSL
jgi:glucokinase